MHHLSEREHHHGHLFRPREVRSLYITSAIVRVADGLSAIFIPLYLWQLGEPLWRIFFFYLLLCAGMVLFIFILLPLLRRMTDKSMMLASIPLSVLYFWGLQYLGEISIAFYVLPLIRALDLTFYNIGYNLDFSRAANAGHIGREVGSRFAAGSLVQALAPFVGGVFIAAAGFNYLFVLVGFLLLLAIVPLLWFRAHRSSSRLRAVEVVALLKDRSLRPFTLSGAGYATEKMAGLIIWPLIIFLAVGSLANFGLIISIGVLVGALVEYGAGFLTDIGRRRRVITIGALVSAAVWLFRPFSATPAVILTNHIAASVSFGALTVAWAAQYYKIAHMLETPDVFIVSREILYNAARVVFLAVLMVLSLYLPLASFFLVASLLAMVASLFFIFANKVHTKNLDELVLTGGPV